MNSVERSRRIDATTTASASSSGRYLAYVSDQSRTSHGSHKRVSHNALLHVLALGRSAAVSAPVHVRSASFRLDGNDEHGDDQDDRRETYIGDHRVNLAWLIASSSLKYSQSEGNTCVADEKDTCSREVLIALRRRRVPSAHVRGNNGESAALTAMVFPPVHSITAYMNGTAIIIADAAADMRSDNWHAPDDDAREMSASPQLEKRKSREKVNGEEGESSSRSGCSVHPLPFDVAINGNSELVHSMCASPLQAIVVSLARGGENQASVSGRALRVAASTSPGRGGREGAKVVLKMSSSFFEVPNDVAAWNRTPYLSCAMLRRNAFAITLSSSNFDSGDGEERGYDEPVIEVDVSRGTRIELCTRSVRSSGACELSVFNRGKTLVMAYDTGVVETVQLRDIMHHSRGRAAAVASTAGVAIRQEDRRIRVQEDEEEEKRRLERIRQQQQQQRRVSKSHDIYGREQMRHEVSLPPFKMKSEEPPNGGGCSCRPPPPLIGMDDCGRILAAAMTTSRGCMRVASEEEVQRGVTLWATSREDSLLERHITADDIVTANKSWEGSALAEFKGGTKKSTFGHDSASIDGNVVPFLHAGTLCTLMRVSSALKSSYVLQRWSATTIRASNSRRNEVDSSVLDNLGIFDDCDGTQNLWLLPELRLNLKMNRGSQRCRMTDSIRAKMTELNSKILIQGSTEDVLACAAELRELQFDENSRVTPGRVPRTTTTRHVLLAHIQQASLLERVCEHEPANHVILNVLLSQRARGVAALVGDVLNKSHDGSQDVLLPHAVRQVAILLGTLLVQYGSGDHRIATILTTVIAAIMHRMSSAVDHPVECAPADDIHGTELNGLFLAFRKLRARSRDFTRPARRHINVAVESAEDDEGRNVQKHKEVCSEPQRRDDDGFGRHDAGSMPKSKLACETTASALRGNIFAAAAEMNARMTTLGDAPRIISFEAYEDNVAMCEVLLELLAFGRDGDVARLSRAADLLRLCMLPLSREAGKDDREGDDAIAMSLAELERGTTHANLRLSAWNLRQRIASSGATHTLSTASCIFDDVFESIDFEAAMQMRNKNIPLYAWSSQGWMAAMDGVDVCQVPPIVSGSWSVMSSALELLALRTFQSDPLALHDTRRTEDEDIVRDKRTPPYYFLPASLAWIEEWDRETFLRVLAEFSVSTGMSSPYDPFAHMLGLAAAVGDDTELVAAAKTAAITHLAWRQDINGVVNAISALPRDVASQPGELRIREPSNDSTRTRDMDASGSRGVETSSSSPNVDEIGGSTSAIECTVVPDVAVLKPTFLQWCVPMISRAVEEELGVDGILTRLYWPSPTAFIGMLARSGLLLATARNGTSATTGVAGEIERNDSAKGVERIVHNDSSDRKQSRAALHALIVRFCTSHQLSFLLYEHLASHRRIDLRSPTQEEEEKEEVDAILSACGQAAWAHGTAHLIRKEKFQAEVSMCEHALFGESRACALQRNDWSERLRAISEATNSIIALLIAATNIKDELWSWLDESEQDSPNDDSTKNRDCVESIPALSWMRKAYPSLSLPLAFHLQRSRVGGDAAADLDSKTFEEGASLQRYIEYRIQEFYSSEGDVSLLQLLALKENPTLRRMLKMAILGSSEGAADMHDADTTGGGAHQPRALLMKGETPDSQCTRLSTPDGLLHLSPEAWEASLRAEIEHRFHSPEIDVGVSLGPDHHLRRGHPLAALTSAITRSCESALDADGVEAAASARREALIVAFKEVEAAAYVTAIDYFDHDDVVAACCAAVELAGRSAWPLRVRLSAVRRVATFASTSSQEEEDAWIPGDSADHAQITSSLARYIGFIKSRYVENAPSSDVDDVASVAVVEMADALESVTLALIRGGSTDREGGIAGVADQEPGRSTRIEHSALWWLVQAFAKCSGLPLRRGYLRKLAEDADWVGLLAQAHADHCDSHEIANIVREHCKRSSVKDHILASLSLLTQGHSSSPSFESPKEGCYEADTELFSVVAAAEAQEYPGQYLLARAVSLRWPVLAIIASCFGDAELRTCLGHWLQCSIVSDKMSPTESTEDVVRLLCRDGVLMPLQRALSLFMPNSALYYAVLGVRRSLQHRPDDARKSFQSASEVMESLVKFDRSSPTNAVADKTPPSPSSTSADDMNRWSGRLALTVVDDTLSSSISAPTASHRLRILRAVCGGNFMSGCSASSRFQRLLLAHEMLLCPEGLGCSQMTNQTMSLDAVIYHLNDGVTASGGGGGMDIDVAKMQATLCSFGRWEDARRWIDWLDGGGMSNDDITEDEVTSAIAKCRSDSWHSPELRLIVWEHVDALMLERELPADRAGRLIMSQVELLQAELTRNEKLFVLKRAKLWLAGEIVPVSNPRRASLSLQQVVDLISKTAMDEILEATTGRGGARGGYNGENVSNELLDYYRSNEESGGRDTNARDYLRTTLVDIGQMSLSRSPKGMSVTKTPLRQIRKGSGNADSSVVVGTPPRSLNRRDFPAGRSVRRFLFNDSSSSGSVASGAVDEEEEEEEEEDHVGSMTTASGSIPTSNRAVLAIHLLLETGNVAEASKIAGDLPAPPIEFDLVLAARTIAEHCSRQASSALKSVGRSDGDISSESARKKYLQPDGPPAALLPVHVIGHLQRHGNLTDVASASAMEYLLAIEHACGEGCGKRECARIRVMMQVYSALDIGISELEAMEERAVFRLLLIRGTPSTRGLLEQWVKHSQLTKESIARELVDCFMNGLLSSTGMKSPAKTPDSSGKSDVDPVRRNGSGGGSRYKSVARSLPFSGASTLSVTSAEGTTASEETLAEDEKYTVNTNDDASVWNASDFQNVANICDDCVELGNALLSGAVSRDAPASCQTELIVLAYHYFSRADPPCFDGMETLMAFAHACAESFAFDQNFRCLMRLIAGIGKYRAMSRELVLLAKHGELELLLQKRVAADAVGGDGNVASLRLAVLHAIRKARPGDRDAEAMVYFHFDMYRSLANLLSKEAALYATSISMHDGGSIGGLPANSGENAAGEDSTKNGSGSGGGGGSGGSPNNTSSSRREKLIEEVGVLLSAAEAFDQSGAPNAAAMCGQKATSILRQLQ